MQGETRASDSGIAGRYLHTDRGGRDYSPRDYGSSPRDSAIGVYVLSHGTGYHRSSLHSPSKWRDRYNVGIVAVSTTATVFGLFAFVMECLR